MSIHKLIHANMMSLGHKHIVLDMDNQVNYLDNDFYDEDDVISVMIDEFLRDFDKLEKDFGK